MRAIQLAVKGVADFVLAALALLVLSPIFLVIAVLIKLKSPGPVFYRQNRLGRDGKPFGIFKFRTMHHGVAPLVNPDGSMYTGKDDPRVYAVGSMLRRFSLDELPQLINVVRGEMSIVGPRPDLEDQISLYDPGEEAKLEMKPGITGWAMVNGRNSIPWKERISLDIWYIRNYNLWLDIKIALLTLPVLMFGYGVSQHQKKGEKA